jgi:hypothetical protein
LKKKASIQKGIQDTKFALILSTLKLDLKYEVAQSVEALRYKTEGRGIASRRSHWNFSLTKAIRSQYNLRSIQSLIEMSTRNISWGDKGGRCLGLTLPPSRADFLENWEPQHPGILQTGPGLCKNSYVFTAGFKHPFDYTEWAM